jgi:SAM-dependent methyltransferase
VETEVRDRRATWGTFEWPDFEELFEARLALEDFSDATMLDLGTGEGRLALHLAARAGRVVGIDTDEESLAAARERARELGISNATFLPADADTANYRLLVRSPIDYVVANHFMSDAAVRNSAEALRPTGRLLFACHYRDHWIESGRVGHFSYTEEAMHDLLVRSGLSPLFLGVERLVVAYQDMRELEEAHPELAAKFRADGRWDALAGKYGAGAVQLTWATLVGVAAKP